MRKAIQLLFLLVFGLFLLSLLISYFYLNSIQSLPKLSARVDSNGDDSIDESIILEKTENEILDVPFGPPLNFTSIGNGFLAFSAYVDARDGNMGYPCVRIPVIATMKQNFKCRLTDREMEGTTYELSENHAMRYRVYIVNCKLPDEKELKRIKTIEIGAFNTKTAKLEFTVVPITYRIPKETEIKDHPLRYSVCLPQLFGNIYTAERIVEFIELYRLQGAGRFHVYVKKESLDTRVSRLLNRYSKEGIVEVINFHPDIQEKSIWYHGQLISVTDCHLRTIGLAKFVSFNDFDEFFIPMTNDSLLSTLEELLSNNTGSIRVPTFYMSIENKTLPITQHNFKCSPQADEV
ncbi:hypothetical protein WR25_01542 isoform C [Diploscapter pachys]|uniref:Glycosyltransferase family 92 protein n=1 Tax=Diploscapter pachys TaxID=2018661 RepID=A0A2A2K5C0_9BILA|nr:hypothetical protein WR25_01542 isoform C [Diploscapter pachys]